MLILLRGHVRDSFRHQTLYEFLKVLSTMTSIEIYIHTWNIIQSGISWRHLNEDPTAVTEDLIRQYFKDLSPFIKHIMIEDDKHIPLIGKKEGTVCRGPCPLVCWKNYWYGQFRAIQYINSCKENKNEVILNMRMDLFNYTHNRYFNMGSVKSFVTMHLNNSNFQKNVFLKDHKIYGIDNGYMGSIHTMYKLIYHFHYHLDEIVERNSQLINQEYMVFDENNRISY